VFNSDILATGARPGATFNYTEAAPDIMEKVRAMEAVAAQAGTTLAAAALHFPLRDPLTVSVLIGTAKPSSLWRNVELLDTPALQDAWPRFDALALSSGG